MHSSDIHNQLVVDEHKHVVVTGEVEHFSTPVGETGLDFGSEVVVLAGLKISVTHAVKGKEATAGKSVDVWIFIGVFQCQVDREWNVHSRYVSVPLGKLLQGIDYNLP